jgi:hypothetical protein
MNGELNFLWKANTDKKPLPIFKEVFEQMYFQFEKLDLSILRKKAKTIELEADVLTKKKPRHFLNKVTQLNSEIEFSINNAKQLTLNEMIKAVKYALKVDFDPKTTSTSLAFSYYYDAVEVIKKNDK